MRDGSESRRRSTPVPIPFPSISDPDSCQHQHQRLHAEWQRGDDVNAILAGNVGLVKSGHGTATLGKVNTYTGNTTIETGTLVVSEACLHDASTITVGTLAYHWPGNVRELENAIERAVILADKDQLTRDELPDYLREEFTDVGKQGVRPHRSLEDIKDEYIAEILKEAGGNKRVASEILKVNPRTLYRFEKKTQPKPNP